MIWTKRCFAVWCIINFHKQFPWTIMVYWWDKQCSTCPFLSIRHVRLKSIIPWISSTWLSKWRLFPPNHKLLWENLPSGYLLHSHGNRWPIEIDGLPNLKMVDLSMANCECHSQMVPIHDILLQPGSPGPSGPFWGQVWCELLFHSWDVPADVSRCPMCKAREDEYQKFLRTYGSVSKPCTPVVSHQNSW